VNIALPHIAADLKLSGSTISWTITSYSLIFGSLLLFGGRAADLLGRRRMFLTGLAVFTVSSFASAMAGSAAMLFASRAGQGLGAAILSPAALSIITSAFHGAARGRHSPRGAQSAERARQSASSSAASSPSSPTGGRSSTSTCPSQQRCSSRP
jgi:MFS family permease